MIYGLWENSLYVQTVLLLLGTLAVLGLLTYSLSNKGPLLNSAWASLKSWIFVIPFVFAILALDNPWPLVFLTLLLYFDLFLLSKD